MKGKVFRILLAILILVVGFYLRFMYVGTPLWYDEACSWMTAVQSFPGGIIDNLLHDDLQHTPLYFFVLHFWIKIFNQSEVAMRCLSLIFGFLSLPLIYVVSKKLFDEKIAICSTMVCCVNPLLVLFSSEVRMYPIVIFLILLSLNFLVDFEQKQNKSSLVKMTFINVLIPYTFTGAIFYNFSLLVSYLWYLLKNKRDYYKKFLFSEVIEWVCLIPYFILILYYAKVRYSFIVSHEGAMHFSDIVDVIRNFFGATITPNVYWPSGNNYSITFLFTILVILPCVYFLYGYIKTLKNSKEFVKTISKIFCLCFCMAVVFAMFKVNVFTVRYIIYVLPPSIILAVAGLSNNIRKVHLNLFLLFFIATSAIFSYSNAKPIKINKENAFKKPAVECLALGLNYKDVLIMPFGSDAPYYFNDAISPIVFNADFHKVVREPKGIYYDSDQQKIMTGNDKYKFILKKINEDNIFSKNFYNYFVNNVISKVENGRYAVLIMYGEDNNIIRPIQELRENIKDERDVKSKMLYTMFTKYMCDIVAMLNNNFKFVNQFQKDNYTYYIYQKI